MIIKRIEGATRTFTSPNDVEPGNVKGLPILDVQTDIGNFMVSAWEPTPAEIQQLINGDTVKLWVRGTVMPVVALTVGEEPE